MEITINEAMALQKAVRGRLIELQHLRNKVALKEDTTYILGDNRQKVEKIEPQYDIKVLDKKVTEIELFMYRIDAAIKQANAITKLAIEADVNKLLEPLQ